MRLVTGRAATAQDLAVLDREDAVVFNDTLVATGHVVMSPEPGPPTASSTS